MIKIEKNIRWAAGILSVLVTTWVVLTALSMSGIDPGWESLDYVRWAADPDGFTTLNYINATLLTGLAVWLFGLLYCRLRKDFGNAVTGGVLFVPVYGGINLFAYSIQITLVPDLARRALESEMISSAVGQLVQADPGSLIGFTNGLAYALLAIPSILFGLGLWKKGKKYSGLLLTLNGILCLTGMIGYLLQHQVLAAGTMAGGGFFLLSLWAMVAEFGKKSTG